MTTCFQEAYPALSYQSLVPSGVAGLIPTVSFFFILSLLYYIGGGGASPGGKWKPRELHRLTGPGRRGSLHLDARIFKGLDRRSRWLWPVPIRLTATGASKSQ